MKFGVRLPALGMFPDPQSVAPFALRMEQIGFDVLMSPDHIALPIMLDADTPISDQPGQPPRPEQTANHPIYECLTLLAYLAGVTSTVGLGTAVNVLPVRNPLLNAKQVATIDALSGGRFIWGVGAGWSRQEFANLGTAHLYERRGKVVDEQIEIFKAVCTGNEIVFEGEHFRIDNTRTLPPTPQQPHPPIFIGANGPRALRRAALRATGWYPVHVMPDEVRDGLAFIKELRDENGLTMEAFDVCVGMIGRYEELRGTDVTMPGNITTFPNSASAIYERVREYEAAGATYVVFRPATNDFGAFTEGFERFAQDVIVPYRATGSAFPPKTS